MRSVEEERPGILDIEGIVDVRYADLRFQRLAGEREGHPGFGDLQPAVALDAADALTIARIALRKRRTMRVHDVDKRRRAFEPDDRAIQFRDQVAPAEPRRTGLLAAADIPQKVGHVDSFDSDARRDLLRLSRQGGQGSAGGDAGCDEPRSGRRRTSWQVTPGVFRIGARARLMRSVRLACQAVEGACTHAPSSLFEEDSLGGRDGICSRMGAPSPQQSRGNAALRSSRCLSASSACPAHCPPAFRCRSRSAHSFTATAPSGRKSRIRRKLDTLYFVGAHTIMVIGLIR